MAVRCDQTVHAITCSSVLSHAPVEVCRLTDVLHFSGVADDAVLPGCRGGLVAFLARRRVLGWTPGAVGTHEMNMRGRLKVDLG